ncbi:MAG: formylglycine-generating enzyme family protein [Verrucomicrobia bacterium]|nr:formylglycine-generating enzyme family protein [Verrucomicrobiota bacterium]
MASRRLIRLALAAVGAASEILAMAAEAPPGMVAIPPGVYRPAFRADSDLKEIVVQPFAIDRYPVTNAEFLEFVRAHPRWRRSQVKPIFADSQYLKHWAGDLELGPGAATNAPATWVSWFAAKAYAGWKGKRLPSTAEWELVAGSGTTLPDGEKDPEFLKQVAAWHSSPAPERLSPVGAGKANFYGVHDLHGLVWEWVSDFNASMVTGDARGDNGLERRLFCGGGAQGAKDVSDYAAYLRFGFRSSLEARYVVHNLGFRCAKTL